MKGDQWRPDLEEVLHYYGARVLNGRGSWQKATCPLNDHEDSSPSASVNLDAGKWNCFSCDNRGDALDIIERNEGLAGFSESLRFAKANFGGSDPTVRDEPGYGGGLLGKPRTVKRAGNWRPPWQVR